MSNVRSAIRAVSAAYVLILMLVPAAPAAGQDDPTVRDDRRPGSLRDPQTIERRPTLRERTNEFDPERFNLSVEEGSA